MQSIESIYSYVSNLALGDKVREDEIRSIIGPGFSVTELKQDASSRKYFRVQGRLSILCMTFGPKLGSSEVSKNSLSDLEKVVWSSNLMSKANVLIPKIYFVDKENNIILLEDLGDRHLIDIARSSKAFDFYCLAVDQLNNIRAINKEDKFLKDNIFTQEVMIREMNEVIDFCPQPQKLNLKRLSELFKTVAGVASKFELVPSHRDFHSWNIIIDDFDRVRVIDYQDVFLASKTYDVLSLLNDRGTDQILGDDVKRRVLEYFYSSIGVDDKNALHIEYLVSLLQRDLKVIGRFWKLAYHLERKEYLKWVPGTIHRVGSTLSELSNLGVVLTDLNVSKNLMECNK